MSVALVTGANSGIGRATAVHLASQGYDVWASMRDLAKSDKLEAAAAEANTSVRLVALDVSSEESVDAAVAQVVAESGTVDVLVNNAGVGGNGVAEFAPIEDYETVMDINVYGALRCLRAVLPHMRAQRSGHVVNVTSIAGVIGAIAQSPYVVSKWAFEGLSEGLAQELAPFGIRVSIIEPGITKSAIFAKNNDAPGIDVYPDAFRWMFQFYANGIPQATPAERVGEVIHHAITTDQPKLRYPVGDDAEAIVAGRRDLSDEQWVQMGAASSDDDYYEMFEDHLGLNIRP